LRVRYCSLLFIGMDRIYPELIRFSVFNYGCRFHHYLRLHCESYLQSPSSHLHLHPAFLPAHSSSAKYNPSFGLYLNVHASHARMFCNVVDLATRDVAERRVRSECFDMGCDKVRKANLANVEKGSDLRCHICIQSHLESITYPENWCFSPMPSNLYRSIPPRLDTTA
jgi:hypothetical protein